MDAAAPELLVALEASDFGRAIRQSVWIYPLANVTHVVSVVAFTAAVAVMDFALLGWIKDHKFDLARRMRPIVVALFLVTLVTGLVLFVAEASHVSMNLIFQLKLLFIALALTNALLLGRRALAEEPGESTAETLAAARIAAVLSLATWIAVVALGRLIAYF